MVRQTIIFIRIYVQTRQPLKIFCYWVEVLVQVISSSTMPRRFQLNIFRVIKSPYFNLITSHLVSEPFELVIMCCMIISVKTMSQTQVNKILQQAYHKFGKEEITNLELKILKRLEFDILLLDETLFDHSTMLLSCLRYYLPENNEQTVFKILEDVISLLYQKTAQFSEFQNITQLAAGCIQGSVALACQINVKFPLTTRLSKIINLNEPYVIQLGQKVLKLLLPLQIVENLIL